MKDFDWIIEHEVVPDLDDNLSFDGIKVIVPRSLVLVEYDGVLHLEGFPKVAKQTKLKDFLKDKFYVGKNDRRKVVPMLPKMKLELVENRNYMPDSLWDKLSQKQKDELTTVKFYWMRRFCFELTISNVKNLYKNHCIRLTTKKNPLL